MKLILPFLILLYSVHFLYGQETFSEDPATFVGELATMLQTTKRAEGKETAELLLANYNEGNLINEQMTMMRTTVLLLMGQNYRLFPQIENYVRAVNNSVKGRIPFSKFKTWNEVLQSLLVTADIGKKPTSEFLQFSVSFLNENILLKTLSKSWIADNNDFRIDYNEGNPKITYSSLTLIGRTEGDTLNIYGTSGAYYPLQETWKGNKGKITWEKTELEKDKVYVDFGKYEMQLSESEFSIDTVSLHYNIVFNKPIKGKLVHKLMTNATTKGKKYPEFTSFERIEMDNLVEGLKYYGGFKLSGSDIKGYANNDLKAELHFFDYNNRLLAITKANSYLIKPKHVVSSRAQLTLFLGEDSITHPGASIKYLIKPNAMIISKGKSGIGRAPFIDSYHDLEMNFERMIYDLDDGIMNISMGISSYRKPAYFHSLNFFEKQTYDQYQGVTSYNPIASLRTAANWADTNVVRADAIAKFFHKDLSLEQIEGTLYQLVADGFIDYDAEKSIVTIKEKVDRYVLANGKKIDHDVIRMKSETDTLNGILNKLTKELLVNGVYSVTLNAKHFVHMFPLKGKIKVHENRDMSFDGTVFGGNIDFFGKDYYFNYDRYDLLLNDLDSIVFNIPTGETDEFGMPVMEPLETVFENINGTLHIDQPYNKSGIEDIAGYPKFVNDKSSYAYYDQNSRFDSIYNRDSFYFEVDTFTIDSLNSFNFYSQQFTGKLVSAGIFPELDERLTIRSDKSMGFVTTTPPEGYELYRGIGRYYDTIDLSNKGLGGNGRIGFLNAEIRTPDILFMPDSMIATVETFEMHRKTIDTVDFPTVKGDSTELMWKPYQDSMVIEVWKKPFRLFDDFADFKGELNLRSTGLKGKGKAEWDEAILRSDEIRIGGNSFRTDTSHLQIKTDDEEHVALDLANVSTYIDFDKNEGIMRSNYDSIQTDLPFNLYSTDMNRFKWLIDQRKIEMMAKYGEDYAHLYSIHKGQDSLMFKAKSATYDLDSFEITAHGVPYIAVADVYVYPANGDVVIKQGAEMKPLENATIKLDSLGQYHTIEQANVRIMGKYRMAGQGKYKYVNRSNQPQRFDFHQISVNTLDDTIYTHAKGVIYDTMNFFLDPQIKFQGNVNLHSQERFLNFKGISKLNIEDSAAIKTSWFKINDYINPIDVQVTASNTVNLRNDSLYSGIHKQADSTNLYTTLIGRKNYYIDNTIFKARGKLKYNKETDEYIVSDTSKLNGTTEIGNLIKYNNSTCHIYAEGKTDLGLNYGLTSLEAIGKITKSITDTVYNFDMMMALDMYFTDEVMDVMYNDLLDITFSTKEVDVYKKEFKKNMLNYVGKQEIFNDIYFELNLNGELIFPKKFSVPTFLFSGAKFHWDEDFHSFIGYGPVGLVSFNGKHIGKYFKKAFIDLGYRRGQDYLELYLEGDNREWYYISYQNKKISVLTSNVVVNSTILNTKIKERTLKEGTEVVQFGVATAFKKNKLYQKMLYIEEKIKNSR